MCTGGIDSCLNNGHDPKSLDWRDGPGIRSVQHGDNTFIVQALIAGPGWEGASSTASIIGKERVRILTPADLAGLHPAEQLLFLSIGAPFHDATGVTMNDEAGRPSRSEHARMEHRPPIAIVEDDMSPIIGQGAGALMSKIRLNPLR
jgi:hypothetical protein